MLKSALTVKRTLSTGEKVLVGKLVENSKQSLFKRSLNHSGSVQFKGRYKPARGA